ncbi:TrmH family RNA methyltransferase [Corynebacterium pseudopelargi]|uniref:TrmH family tRNA/rRNA methyltransferase n=1 Tax=Corynebacterium pseudopelargi TaxID=2080757 RepID=A0A3G6IVQ4_9CORY|nr:RNA methyltransferase [Corynebacterium pseudopelargi]AZA09726.1 Putative TrmH family tRNA/rRNA methyltransferase [Corynebacterium pseudopelargi]
MLEHLTNPDDPRLDDFRDLNHSDQRPDLPGGKGLVIAEGPLVVGRLLASRFPVRKLIGFPSKLESFLAEPGISELVQDVEIYSLDRPTLAKVAGFDMHRGLLAAADRVEEMSIEQAIQGATTIAVLEGVGDHENIGSMFRNAAGMGVDAVLFGNGCADPLYRRVVRVSMGHVLRTPFASFGGKRATWHKELDQLREAGFRLVSLTPDANAAHLADALVDASGKPFEKVALLVGAEGPGLSEKTMRATDIRARIPMAEGTDSLNLATAAAIAFYERDRSLKVDQRGAHAL